MWKIGEGSWVKARLQTKVGNGALVAGVVPGHLQTTAKLPLTCLCLNSAGMGSRMAKEKRLEEEERAHCDLPAVQIYTQTVL